LAIMIGAEFVNAAVRCACAGAPLLGQDGSHALVCTKIAHKRHNGVRDVLYRTLKAALGSSAVTRESTVGPDGEPMAPDGDLRPIDIGYRCGDSWSLYDIVFSGTQPPTMTWGKRTAGSRMAADARIKKKRQQQRAGTEGVQPMAFGALGGVDAGTRSALSRITTTTGVDSTTTLARIQAAAWLPTLQSVAVASMGGGADAQAIVRQRHTGPLRRPQRPATTRLNHSSLGSSPVLVLRSPTDSPPTKRHRRTTTSDELGTTLYSCITMALWHTATDMSPPQEPLHGPFAEGIRAAARSARGWPESWDRITGKMYTYISAHYSGRTVDLSGMYGYRIPPDVCFAIARIMHEDSDRVVWLWTRRMHRQETPQEKEQKRLMEEALSAAHSFWTPAFSNNSLPVTMHEET
jgi:hypothetical protein